MNTNQIIGRITTCKDCGYHAMTWNVTRCSRCNGELEIIATTNLSADLQDKTK
jgi:predicted Zn-ribbon and HTH transcriptional regulator